MIIVENKNTFEDLLGLEIETEDKFLNKKLNSHVCYSGGGGGGQKQQDIAPTLRPYVTDVLSRAKGQVDAPYQAYPGERVVGFTPQELAAQGGIQQMAGQYGLASMAPGLTSSASYYMPAYGYLGQTGEALGVGAGALAESGDIQRGAARQIGLDEVGKFALTGEDIQRYMDPYQQAVTDIEKRQARQDALQTAQAIGAKSTGAGAFGGSRQAILEAQAASDLGTRLADIQTRGSQAAYQQALQTAAQQQQVGLGQAAQQRAREQQLGSGIAGLAGQYGQLAGGLGALSGQYGSLGQQALGQGYRELGYLSGVGEAQRGMGQQRADVAFGEFQQQRDYPMQQLERYAGMAFGVPSGYLQQQQAMPSGFQQAVGGITTAAGLGRGLGFFKEGGDIGKGGLSTVYREPGGKIRPGMFDFTRGDIADLQRQYEAEEDPEKKEDLRRKLIIKGGEQLQSTSAGRRFADPNVMNPADFLSLNIADKSDDTGLERVAKFAGRSALEIPAFAIDLYKGAAGATRSGREYLTTPLDELDERKKAEEEQYQAYEKTRAEAEIEAEEKPVETDGARFASLLSQFNDLTDRSESVEELRKLTQEAFKFDKDKKAKSIKAQQGFDIAALGMQLMSKPLEEIDPKYVSQLGVSGKKLDNLDQEEAMSLYKAKVAELGLSKTIAEIQKEQAGFTADLGDFTKLSAELQSLLPSQTASQQTSRILKATEGMSDTEAARYILKELKNISENPKAYLIPSGDNTDDALKKDAEKRF